MQILKQLLLFYDDLHVATREMYVQYLLSRRQGENCTLKVTK